MALFLVGLSDEIGLVSFQSVDRQTDKEVLFDFPSFFQFPK